MSLKENSKITKGFVEGDEKVISDFYLKNLPIISNYISKNSGNATDAEDVFQDALVLTYQKLRGDSLNLNCSLATYVFAVSRNLWMNTLRKRRKIVLNDDLLGISKDVNESIIDAIHSKDKQFLFQKYFLKLGQSCQGVLMHFFSGKSMAKISELMGYSEGYTRKKKFECKKQLLEMIINDPMYRELSPISENTKGLK